MAEGRTQLPETRAMPIDRRAVLMLPLLLAACGGTSRSTASAPAPTGLHSGETPEMRALIRKYAAIHGIPESLLHRVIQRESGYNAGARNGPYYGLMQILPQTAHHGLSGPARGLAGCRDQPDLRRALPARRLAGLGRVEDKAVMWYAKGYYYEAKRKGLLKETGLRT
jgi:hypothetical protein